MVARSASQVTIRQACRARRASVPRRRSGPEQSSARRRPHGRRFGIVKIGQQSRQSTPRRRPPVAPRCAPATGRRYHGSWRRAARTLPRPRSRRLHHVLTAAALPQASPHKCHVRQSPNGRQLTDRINQNDRSRAGRARAESASSAGFGARPRSPCCSSHVATLSNRSACRGTRINRRLGCCLRAARYAASTARFFAFHRAARHEHQVGRRQPEQLAAVRAS